LLKYNERVTEMQPNAKH